MTTHKTTLGSGDPGFEEKFTAELVRAATAPKLLIALDFDGTLAPFTTDIAASRAVPAAEAALERLSALENTWVGVISGRTMEFLHSAVDPNRRMLLSGSHGGEYDLSVLGAEAPRSGIDLSPEQSSLLVQAQSAAAALVERYPGATAEMKPAGVAFHARTMREPEKAEEALHSMNAAFTQLGDLKITPGDMVMESSVLTSNKGEAVQALVRAVEPDVAIFAGDDVTDEYGLEVLREQDLGIKVGPKDTVAPFRVADPDVMGEVLTRLADLRGEHLG